MKGNVCFVRRIGRFMTIASSGRGIFCVLVLCLSLFWAGCSGTSSHPAVVDGKPGQTTPPPAKITPTGEKQFAYTIEVMGDNSTQRVREDYAFHGGDRFRFLIKPGFSAYVYMLDRGTGESKYTVLFPLSNELTENPIKPDVEQPVPGDATSWMAMNEKPGEEDFILIVSTVPLLDFTNKSSMSNDDCERAIATVERMYHPPSSRRFEDGDLVKFFAADPGHDIAMVLRLPLKHS